MSKLIISLIVSIALVGCDQLPNNPKDQMKWAVVDKNKIDKFVIEFIKKNNPASAELDNEEESYRERSKIERQISEIEADATKTCVSANTSSDKKISPAVSENLAGTIHPSPSMNSRGELNINGHYVPLSAISNFPRVTNQDNYRNCLSNVSKDPLIADLQEQINKLDNLRLARNRYNEEIRKKTAEYTNTILTKYAEANHFELIVGNNSGGGYILYNANKVSLDVTDDVLAFISKIQESTTSVIDTNHPAPQ